MTLSLVQNAPPEVHLDEEGKKKNLSAEDGLGVV